VICSSVGTGGTLAGLINSSVSSQVVIGFNALKNSEVENQISQYTEKRNWRIEAHYTFGGYAKVNDTLISFMNSFYQQYRIPLDPIYTGKLLFGIFDLIKQNKWQWGKKILIIHTGGLQGVKGMNLQLQKKRKTPFTLWQGLALLIVLFFFFSCGSSRKVVIRESVSTPPAKEVVATPTEVQKSKNAYKDFNE
jgi:1-aminocyclopropane-1-carboxylate deaminase